MNLPSQDWLYIWIVVCVLGILLEFGTRRLIAIWFAVGAGLAIFINYHGMSLWLQLGTFVLCGAGLSVLFRPTVEHVMKTVDDVPDKPQNAANDMINKVGSVVQVMPNGYYRVYINGQNWQAYSPDQLQVNDRVVVTGLNGVTLTVELSN